MEIAGLPLKQVFAIIDLFQGVLEPFEFFLQGKKKHFNVLMGSPWLTLEIPTQPQNIVNQPLNKTVPQVMSAGLLSNLDIQNNYRETNIFINMSSTSLEENIRPTKITGRAKEESICSCLRCVAALIREEMVFVRGKGA